MPKMPKAPTALAVPIIAFSLGLMTRLAVDVCIGSDVFVAVGRCTDDVDTALSD